MIIKNYANASKDLRKKNTSNKETSSFCDVKIAIAGTCHWRLAVEMLCDSGADMTCVPRSFFPEDFLINIETVDHVDGVFANGDTEKSTVVKVDLRLETVQGGNMIIQNVLVALLENGTQALLGSDILAFIDYRNIDGKMIFLRPSATYYDLEEAHFEKRSIQSVNVDPKTNQAKPAMPAPRPQDLGAKTTPLKDGFGKPLLPQAPIRSR